MTVSEPISLDNDVPMVHYISMLNQLDSTYRIRQIGETVKTGDMLQIANSYFPVDGSIWVGDTIEHGGTFERVWTKQR